MGADGEARLRARSEGRTAAAARAEQTAGWAGFTPLTGRGAAPDFCCAYQSYEVGRRRIPVSALPVVARTLSVSLEDLFGEPDSSPRKRAPMPRWQKHLEAVLAQAQQ